MRQRRTIYFNDARHYYLFVFEPPIEMEDAWVPIDEVAGTGVDTFSYGVARGDGLFYPSKIGLLFGSDIQPFEQAAYWRIWSNMQSLMERGLDPLTVLIDRAHEKRMDFIASLRMGNYGGMDPDHKLDSGGRGWAHEEVRDHQFAVLQELSNEYETDGVEMDFSSSPGGSSFWLKPEDVEAYTPVMTDFVRQSAEMVRSRAEKPGILGARVYPTEEMNLKTGLDVRTWLEEGLVDYVVPLVYAYFVLDANMPFGWLVEAAHENEISVYGMLQPYRLNASDNATAQMMRAAAANFWALGVDGLYTWFMSWPLGETDRGVLADLGDPELVKQKDKHYFLRNSSDQKSEHDYPAFLPLEIPSSDTGRVHQIPFSIADDCESDRVRSIKLRINITDLVTADRLEILLNGRSLASEPCRRTFNSRRTPYSGQWLEFDLQEVRPVKGQNTLQITLQERPKLLVSPLRVEEVEIIVGYGVFPSALNYDE